MSDRPSKLVHHIRPRLVRCVPRPSRIVGPPLDTWAIDADAVRAVLLFGEPADGAYLNVEWGFRESDTPAPESFRPFTTDQVLYHGDAPDQGLIWQCIRIGAEAGRRRHLRGEIALSGDVLVCVGLVLEFFAGDPDRIADPSHVGELGGTPFDGRLPGV